MKEMKEYRKPSEVFVRGVSLADLLARENHGFRRVDGGLNLSGADLSNIYLNDSDLRDSNFSKADLSGSNLSGSVFSGSNFRHTKMVNVVAYNARFNFCNFSHVDFSGSHFYGSNFSSADLLSCSFVSSSFRNASFQSATFLKPDFLKTDFSGTNFANAEFKKFPEFTLDQIMFSDTTSFLLSSCPEVGSFIGFRRVGDVILKLEIQEDAERESSGSRRCRASAVRTLSITNPDGSPVPDSLKSVKTFYPDVVRTFTVGEITSAPFTGSRWNNGILFYLTRIEAVNSYPPFIMDYPISDSVQSTEIVETCKEDIE